MGHFHFHSTSISGLYRIERIPLKDRRGYFERLFCQDDFRELGLKKPLIQINHTLTKDKGTIRGLHFQYPPFTETKIVQCLRGSIFDVAVDIRTGSATFLQWHGEILSAKKGISMYIPDGFAHGYQALEPNTELLYFHTTLYQPEAEGGLHFTDPRLAIEWEYPPVNVSKKDQGFPKIKPDFKGITL